MSWRQRIRALFNQGKLSADLDEELEFHFAMRKQLNVQDGMSEKEAASAARRQIGNKTQLKEHMREIDLFTFPDTVWQDVRFAFRMLAKHRRFTFTAILALGLGIGVNTAVFTLYRAFLLRPLDANNAKELVNVSCITDQGRYDANFSYPDFESYRDRNHVFSGLIAATADEVTLSDAGGSASSVGKVVGTVATAVGFRMPSVMAGTAEFVSVSLVSDNYFSVLETNPTQGRTFDSDDAHSTTPVVIISENYRRRRFAADPALIGKSVKLNGVAFTVIGISPQDFMGTSLNVPSFWIPLRFQELLHPGDDILHDRENACCRLNGRLLPGVRVNEAQAEMNLLAEQLRSLHAAHSDLSKPLTIQLRPGSPFGRDLDINLRFAIALIMSAVGMILVIACANLASLQLARSAARQSEIGIRISLGASRSRLIRQLLTESALLGIAAGAVSMVITYWVLRLFIVEIAAALPAEWGAFALRVSPDMQIFGYVFAISLLAGVLFGLLPALESSKANLISAIKEESTRFLALTGKNRLRDGLIAVQVAICLVLMINGGLLLRSSIRTLRMDTGYETKHVLSLEVNFPDGFGYTREKEVSEVRALEESLRSLPSVESVSIGRSPAGGGLRSATVTLEGEHPSAENSRILYYNYVQANYFGTLNIPLSLGHGFSMIGAGIDPAAIVSESAARDLWPGRNPVGQKLTLDGGDQFHSKDELLPVRTSYQVVGVAKDTRGVLIDGTDIRKVYLPLPAARLDDRPLLIRTKGDPWLLKDDIGRILRSLDSNMIVNSFTLDDLLRTSPQFVIARCAALFASAAGSLGLLLASIGIYGTVSYAVVRRTREVGIRVALGATKRNVLGLILVESTRPVVLGLLVGIIGAIGVAQLMRAILFGVTTLDAVSYVGVSALFFTIAMLAAYLPARKATRVDPMVALRYE